MSGTDFLTPMLDRRSGMSTLSPRDWEDLLGQARRSRLTARLAECIGEQVGLAELSAGPRRHLCAAASEADRLAKTVLTEVSRIERALRPAGLRCVLLKGAAYLCAGLPASRGRLFGDIDILVPQADLGRAESALLAAGWLAAEQDPYDSRYYRQWMHELPPLNHVHRDSTIDVHHTITPPTSAFNIGGARLLEAARPIDAECRFWMLQPVDMVLHSAVHLFQEGEFDHGLRDLLDMDDLLRHFAISEVDFWSQLLVRANELSLQVPLHHALHHVERLFGSRAPEPLQGAVAALAPPWPQRRLMASLLGVALRPPHPSCRQPGDGLARWLLYVRSHWLRMPLHLLMPHLARKAWMARFPAKKSETAPVGR